MDGKTRKSSDLDNEAMDKDIAGHIGRFRIKTSRDNGGPECTLIEIAINVYGVSELSAVAIASRLSRYTYARTSNVARERTANNMRFTQPVR